ncbi:hypothetical protein [Tropicimonas aquimaris]|uniref:Uncharacterized protein n=1 Tax=Tropicimonas aquimaris TaxID=914152 RepID=A0ABW3IR25_9RHOB
MTGDAGTRLNEMADLPRTRAQIGPVWRKDRDAKDISGTRATFCFDDFSARQTATTRKSGRS